jgi:hypothetical protein
VISDAGLHDWQVQGVNFTAKALEGLHLVGEENKSLTEKESFNGSTVIKQSLRYFKRVCEEYDVARNFLVKFSLIIVFDSGSQVIATKYTTSKDVTYEVINKQFQIRSLVDGIHTNTCSSNALWATVACVCEDGVKTNNSKFGVAVMRNITAFVAEAFQYWLLPLRFLSVVKSYISFFHLQINLFSLC